MNSKHLFSDSHAVFMTAMLYLLFIIFRKYRQELGDRKKQTAM